MAQSESLPAGVALVDVAPYSGCFEIRNDSVRVVLGHQRGGRVLIYERDGRNVLYFKDESSWDPNSKGFDSQLSAGRFDVGPEQLQTRGNTFWHGEWQAEATGDREVTMTSATDEDSGLQLTRIFKLDASSSRLSITQTVTNRGESPVRQCYWSRTFAVHGGVVIVPCDSSKSLMPNLYCMAPNGKTLNIRPQDSAIRRVNDFLVIDGPPGFPKLGMDSVKGWVAYQTREHQLFVKRFPTSATADYGELAGYNLSVFYPLKDRLATCEVEPIGPMKTLAPGETDSYTVQWWLLDNKFEDSGKVDPHDIESIVNRECKNGD